VTSRRHLEAEELVSGALPAPLGRPCSNPPRGFSDSKFLHLRFAAGGDRSPLEDAYYGPLVRVDVSRETEVIAGFVQESETLTTRGPLPDSLRPLAAFFVGSPADLGQARPLSGSVSF
jgi:hypothetical protein